jgi:hypothetical protein
MTKLSVTLLGHHGPMTLSGGLGFAIKFAEKLGSAHDGLTLDLDVSGVRDELFFDDNVRDRGVFVTTNNMTSSGRIYLGLSRDLNFETNSPKEWLRARDWQNNELETVVSDVVRFLTETSSRKLYSVNR